MAGAASEIADRLGAAKQPGEEGGIHPGTEELLAQLIPAARLGAEERPRARRPAVKNAARPAAVLLDPGYTNQLVPDRGPEVPGVISQGPGDPVIPTRPLRARDHPATLRQRAEAVSYTHLTLPTKRIV